MEKVFFVMGQWFSGIMESSPLGEAFATITPKQLFNNEQAALEYAYVNKLEVYKVAGSTIESSANRN